MRYLIYHSDNAILTHIIKCEIDVDEMQGQNDLKSCQGCGENATKYCENDQQYFCDQCDLIAHGEEDDEIPFNQIGDQTEYTRKMKIS